MVDAHFQRVTEAAGLYGAGTKLRWEKNKLVYLLLPSLTTAYTFTKNRSRKTWETWFYRWPQAAASLPLPSGWCPSALPTPAPELQPPPTEQPVFLCPTGPHSPKVFSKCLLSVLQMKTHPFLEIRLTQALCLSFLNSMHLETVLVLHPSDYLS